MQLESVLQASQLHYVSRKTMTPASLLCSESKIHFQSPSMVSPHQRHLEDHVTFWVSTVRGLVTSILLEDHDTSLIPWTRVPQTMAFQWLVSSIHFGVPFPFVIFANYSAPLFCGGPWRIVIICSTRAFMVQHEGRMWCTILIIGPGYYFLPIQFTLFLEATHVHLLNG